jgi:Uncharacterized protein conserved in bacteria
MGRKLVNAVSLYLEGIRDGQVRQAVGKYTGDRYTQHSTGVRDGAEGVHRVLRLVPGPPPRA